ncbi:MAG TPA: DUF2207 domain-containing protein [Lapillicoccus sp.]|uniref:DUF2207 domain-containing protein n=1 Tax=Lapillicoccus sp. TaxID=1909287 RepID=UPI002F91D1EF
MRGRLPAVLALLLAAAVLVGLPATAYASPPAVAAPAANGSFDRMSSFTADYVLDAEGGATVTETIDYVFGTSSGAKHGIYRNIVTRQAVNDPNDKSNEDTYRYYALDLESVTSPTGAPTKAQLTDQSGGQTQIRIGDPDVTVSGSETYVLTYHLANVMNPFPDHAEFFYNVFLGDAIPKDHVKVTVTGPGGVTTVNCVRGSDPGKPCDSAEAGPTAVFTVANLLGNEDLTIATSLPRAGFGELKPDIRVYGSAYDEGQAKVLSSLALAGGIGAPLLAAGVMGVLVATRGRDEWYAGVTPGLSPAGAGSGATDAVAPGTVPPSPQPTRRGRKPEIAVQFNPPPGVQPGMVGTVIDESADTIDVSATVMDLAVRGFMRIEEIQDGTVFSRTDWRLVQLPPPAGQTLRPYEATVLDGIFATGSDIKLSELKYKFHTTLNLAIRQMYTEVVERGWFRRSPQTQRAGWQALGFLLIGAGVVSCFYLGVITRAIDQTGGVGIGIPSGVVLGIGLIVAGLIFRILGKRMAAKTAAGSAVYAQSLGFRKYLETAEAGQIRFEEASAIFSRYLPYAIVFGVADRWAGTFQKVAEAAAATGSPLIMPTWYLYSGAMFPDFTSIADGAGSFASSAGGTFAATASSGSSGGSAFSGGGFSGGGGMGGSSSGSW